MKGLKDMEVLRDAVKGGNLPMHDPRTATATSLVLAHGKYQTLERMAVAFGVTHQAVSAKIKRTAAWINAGCPDNWGGGPGWHGRPVSAHLRSDRRKRALAPEQIHEEEEEMKNA